jgi:hypothetical protein
MRHTPAEAGNSMTPRIPYVAGRTVLVTALLVLLVAPIWLVRYPPLQDYPDLLMQGAILRNWTNPALHLGQIYRLQPGLPPRLAALSLLTLLGRTFNPETAGRLTISVYLLLFPLSVSYLFRAVRRQSSSAELVAFLLAYNFWFFQGSLDFLLGMAVVCFSLGYLVRHWAQLDGGLAVRLAAFSILCYLSHIMAYVVLALVVGLLWLVTPDHRRRRSALAVAAVLPGLLLLAAYLLVAGHAGGALAFTPSLPNKLVAYVMPLLTFFRFEPFAAALPVTFANILLWAAAGALLLVGVDRERPVQAPHLLIVGGILLAVALVAPVQVGQLWRFDDRLVLPAYLLLATAVRFRPRTVRQDLCWAALTIAVCCLQFIQMQAPSARLAEVQSAVLPLLTPDKAIAGFTILDYPIRPGCLNRGLQDVYSIASFPTIRFPVYQLLDTGRYDYGSLFDVGLLQHRQTTQRSDLVVKDLMRSDAAAYAIGFRDQTSGQYDLIEVFGCESDIEITVSALAGYDLAYRAEGVAILSLRQ